MGLIQRRTNLTLGSIGSTRLYNVTTEMLYTISTGYIALEVTNLGDSIAYYGDTNVTTNSGGILNVHGSKFWDNVSDDFTLYFVSPNATSLVFQEYRGQ
jgi:hypothetical protein